MKKPMSDKDSREEKWNTYHWFLFSAKDKVRRKQKYSKLKSKIITPWPTAVAITALSETAVVF